MSKEHTMTETPEGADISALQRQVAAIIVRDVLQEDFDDLVEGDHEEPHAGNSGPQKETDQ
jgi:hypothetical protein